MKKYTTILTVLLTVPVFTGAAWAHNKVEQDMHDDGLHGHGAVTSSPSSAYEQGSDRTGQIGTDVMSYPQDFKSGSPSSPSDPKVGQHDDHEDTLHAIAVH